MIISFVEKSWNDYNYWSKRITDEHRLVYKIEENQMIIISCRFHYD